MKPLAAVAPDRREGGFALVLALLAMMLLTFLGLTLAVTTTTELQIASNYKWSQQAFFNAEAGIEAGRRALRIPGPSAWKSLLPEARLSSWDPGSPPSTLPAAPDMNASRNYENAQCDTRGGIGYGAVLSINKTLYQNLSLVPGVADPMPTDGGGSIRTSLPGTFTLWVRRPLVPDPADSSKLTDYRADDDTLILTAEGSAPFTVAAASSTYVATNRAVRTMEIRLSRVLAPCGTRSAQAGAGGGGAGYAACTTLDGNSLTDEIQAAGAAGTGAILNAGEK